VLAYAQNFPDGLCGGSLANSMGGPLLLVENGKVTAAEKYTNKKGVVCGVILGGQTLISDVSARTVYGLRPTAEIVVK